MRKIVGEIKKHIDNKTGVGLLVKIKDLDEEIWININKDQFKNININKVYEFNITESKKGYLYSKEFKELPIKEKSKIPDKTIERKIIKPPEKKEFDRAYWEERNAAIEIQSARRDAIRLFSAVDLKKEYKTEDGVEKFIEDWTVRLWNIQKQIQEMSK